MSLPAVVAELVEAVKRAAASGDDGAAGEARSAMYDALFPMYRLSSELAAVWNDLAPRAAKTE